MAMQQPPTTLDEHRNSGPIHRFISDHGRTYDSESLTHTSLAGQLVTVLDTLSDTERDFLADAIEAVEPGLKNCFETAMGLWNYDSRFTYAEGFATISEVQFPAERAWSLLNGETLVDVTGEYEGYRGVPIKHADVLSRHYDIENGAYDVLGNHKNRHRFLRNHGYIH